jgi:hypothetical protein
LATGACCAADGTCTVGTEADCLAAGGTYQGDGTDCDPNPCPQPGAHTLTLTPDATCYTTNGGTVTVDIDFAQTGTDEILGGQFFLEYDETKLDFVSADTGDAPFTNEVYEDVNETAGTIDYAVGLPLASDPGYNGTGPLTMATITFQAIGEVCDVAELVTFRDTGAPYVTRLTRRVGVSGSEPFEPGSLVNLAAVTLDWTEPVLENLPTGGDLGCNPATLPDCDGNVTATDNCSGTVTVDCVAGTIDENGCERSQTFTYSATDACGNTASDDVIYTWTEDTTAPVFDNLPTGGDLGCNPTPPACEAVTATDNCDGSLTADCVAGTIDENGCQRSQTFTYSATDACGNTASDDVMYTWIEDTTEPVLENLPTGGDLGCNPATLPDCDGNVTATDNCSGTVTVDCVAGTIEEDGCERSQTFTYSATDACGNTASDDVIYTWTEDTTAPVFDNLPTGGDLGCNPTPPACEAVTATDNCDGSLTADCVAGTIDENGCQRSQTFTYSATDACGNTASDDVMYTWIEDTTEPVLENLPTGGDLGCNPATLPDCDGNVTATDNCSGTVTVDCVAGTIDENGCERSQTFTYSATDACGNTASDDVIYTWTEDTTAPVFDNLPTGGDLGCNPTPPACEAVTATDNCDGSLTADCVAGTIEEDGCERSQTFTYSATDACGNTASDDVMYTWIEDTTEPVLENLPTGGDLGCNPATLPDCDGNVTATDNCSGTVTVDCVAGTIEEDGCERSQTFTYSATDACGNTASDDVMYTWIEDTTEPVITVSDDISVNADAGLCTATVTWDAATAVDECDGNLSAGVEYDIDLDNDGTVDVTQSSTTYTFSAGTHKVIARVTDSCGNTGSNFLLVTVLGFSDFVVDVQLQGVDTAVTRCITFTFVNCTTMDTATLEKNMAFDATGLGSATFTDLACGAYDCVTAEDDLHTLLVRLDSAPDFEIVAGQYVANFTGANTLTTADYYNDNLIDIGDFGVFIVQWGACYDSDGDTFCDGDTPCGVFAENSHADANGDGVLDVTDFNLISGNFLSLGDDDCCTRGRGADGAPRTEITVQELRRAGVRNAWRADLNGDGWIDLDDIQLFMNGEVPDVLPTPVQAHELGQTQLKR